MAEYTNDLRIKEIGIGEEAGAWGTTLNTQLGLLAEGFSYGVENLGSDANATITMADGASDEARSLYLKITSTSLSATRTVTLAPQSVSKVWIIENATTGSQSITITQGEGQHGVTIPNGQVKVVYSTGDSESPSGVYDALDNLELGGAATAATSVTAPLIEGSTSIQTPLIEYTDGDDAITIADGGGITAANGITSTAAANTFGATSFNDADITNVGSISLDSIVSDTSPGAIQINSGGDKLRIDGTVGIGTDAHDTQALHILSSARHLRLENAGSPGEIGLIGLLDDGQLDIWAHGDNSTDIITFRTGSSTGTERVRIANDGKLLIGHSTARNVGYSDSSVFRIEGTSYANASIATVLNSNNANGAAVVLGKSRGTSVGSNTIVQSGDNLGVIDFAGSDGTDMAHAGVRIRAQVDGTPGSNDMPGRLTIETTADGSSSPVERMRIQNSGITQFKTGDGNSGIAEFHTNASTGNATAYISHRPQGTAVGYIGNGTSLLSGADNSDFIVRGETYLLLNSGGNQRVATLTDTSDLSLNGDPRSTSYINGKLATNIVSTRRVAFYSSANMDATFRAQGSNSCYLGIMAGATRLSNDASYLYFAGNTDANGGSWSAYMKHITGDNHAKGKLKFLTCDGSLWHNVLELTNTGTDKVLTNSGDVGTISDQRLKKNIQDLTYSLETFKDLKPRTFEWINPSEHEEGTVNGFIAQELPDPYKYGYQIEKTNTIDQGEKVDNPDYDLVKDTNGEALAGKLGQSDAMYVSVIQQLITKIENLETEVNSLKGE